MRIYLITHAHTEQVQAVASDAWRLSARGVEQAGMLGQRDFWREVSRVIVSSEPKTLLTVQDVVRQRKFPVWVDSRFDELRRSGWIENYGAQVAKVFANPMQGVDGWESVESVHRRARAGLSDLEKRFHGETLALVGHGLCLSILRADLLGTEQVDFERWQRTSFAAVAFVELSPPSLLQDFDVSTEVVR